MTKFPRIGDQFTWWGKVRTVKRVKQRFVWFTDGSCAFLSKNMKPVKPVRKES